MILGKPARSKQPLNVGVMFVALVLAAFLGAAAGLVWQSADWFSEEPEDEVLADQTGATPASQ